MTTPSPSSQKSTVSSFAYLLRDRRNDMRLLKKKSKPSQHLQKNTGSEKQRPTIRRSSSSYKPKVIEDTAISQPVVASPSIPPALSDPRPMTPKSSPPPTPFRRSRSSLLPREPALFISVPRPLPILQLPQRPHFGPLGDLAQPEPKSLRISIETPPRSDSRTRALSPVHHIPTPYHHQHGHVRPSTDPTSNSRFRFDDPPEAEPRTPFDTQDRHGDHYFRTFGVDTMYQKEPSPPRIEAHPNERKPISPPLSPGPRQFVLRTVKDPSVSSRNDHRPSSLFGKRRSAAISDPISEASTSRSGKTTPSSAKATPDIVVSSPMMSKSRRSSYFARAAHRKQSSEATPGSLKSGLSIHWEDVAANGKRPSHKREWSDSLSPLSSPTLSTRPKLKRVREEMDVSKTTTRQLPEDSIAPVVPSGPVAGSQPEYRSSSGEEYYKASLTGPNALNFLPSETKRVDTPPMKKKPGGFKGFFFDIRSMPDEPPSADAETPEAAVTTRRRPIIPKGSFHSLISKLSKPKLKHKPSHLSEEEQEFTLDPLKFTDFQQTPFSQRYGDARRAKMSQARTYMEEALKADDNDDDEYMFQFEFNVPDHLPNSPLRPLNAKHKSGGKAICPIHGRKKMSVAPKANMRETREMREGNAVKREPKIVYESGAQGDGEGHGRFEEEFRRKTSRDS